MCIPLSKSFIFHVYICIYYTVYSPYNHVKVIFSIYIFYPFTKWDPRKLQMVIIHCQVMYLPTQGHLEIPVAVDPTDPTDPTQ
jgi:hypothetical protein